MSLLSRPPRRIRWSTLPASAAAGTIGSILWLSAMPAAAEVPSGWTEVARDGYARSSSGNWGRADVGGSYSHSGANAGLGTVGGIAWVKLNAGQQVTNTLGSVSARDVNISDTFTLASGPSTFDMIHGWRVRVQSDGSAYSARVRMDNQNRPTLGVTRLNGSASTWLSGVTMPLTYTRGMQIRGELQVTGTSPVVVQARAWKVGSAAPAWQVSYNDSAANRLQTAGAVATSNGVQSGAGVSAINSDNLSVGSSGGTAPAPAPAPAPTGSRGSASVGSASYPIPSGAIFVDVNRGSDANPGTQASPFKTLKSAVTRIPSGGARTFVLRAGVYHESVSVDASRTAVIQNYPGEAVWFDGSVPVAGWAQSGTRWVYRGWRAEFSSMMGGDQTFKNWFLNTNKMAANPDMVLINGTQQAQVGTAGEVVAGKFHVDYATDILTIGTDPTGKEVRAADLRQALFLSGKNSVVQGIGVRRYANGYELKGAVRVINTGGAVRNVVVQDTATFGITVSSPGKTIDHVTVQRAGMTGLGGHQADNSSVTNSILSDNNHERFAAVPEAGGMKFTASRTMTVKNNEANNNVGAIGIWFDVSCYNLTVVNNTANGNTKYGIAVEVSGRGIVANNQTVGGEAGIIIFDSNDFKVFNNEVGSNTLFGIKLAQDERRQASLGTHPYARDNRVSGVDPNVTWLTQNVQVSNNVFGLGNRNHSHLYALDGRSRRAVDLWNLTINGNLFNGKKIVSSDATMVSWGKGDNVTVERYETPAALAAAKNSGWKNAQLPSFKSLPAMSADKVSYASTAVPIPSDVAAATGRLAAGSRVLGVK